MNHVSFLDKSVMTPEARRDWLLTFAGDLRSAFLNKYHEGTITHKGDLGEVDTMKLLDEVWAEQLDQLAYTGELKRRMLMGYTNVYHPDIIRVVTQILDREVLVGNLSAEEQAALAIFKAKGLK